MPSCLRISKSLLELWFEARNSVPVLRLRHPSFVQQSSDVCADGSRIQARPDSRVCSHSSPQSGKETKMRC